MNEVDSSAPQVLVLRAAGINCDEETAHAFRLAGAAVTVVHVGELVRGERQLSDFDALAVPGGFSYGDDLGAGTVLANQLRTRLGGDLHSFVDSGRLVLGICNGFQVLVRLGLLPGIDDDAAASLVVNQSGKYEDRWVHLRVDGERCPFLDGARESGVIRLPVAHREGRFVVRDEATLERLASQGQIALRYSEASGEPTADYPANPNGSTGAIAGVTNPAGNVLGLMPHPERFLRFLHDPAWTRRVRSGGLPEDEVTAGDGFSLFASAVQYLRDRSVAQ